MRIPTCNEIWLSHCIFFHSIINVLVKMICTSITINWSKHILCKKLLFISVNINLCRSLAQHTRIFYKNCEPKRTKKLRYYSPNYQTMGKSQTRVVEKKERNPLQEGMWRISGPQWVYNPIRGKGTNGLCLGIALRISGTSISTWWLYFLGRVSCASDGCEKAAPCWWAAWWCDGDEIECVWCL